MEPLPSSAGHRQKTSDMMRGPWDLRYLRKTIDTVYICLIGTVLNLAIL